MLDTKKFIVKSIMSRISSKILYKIKTKKKKVNNKLLVIDLLKTESQKNLLSIVLAKVEEIYTKILQKRNPQAFMVKHGEKVFLQGIKQSCENFLLKEYGYSTEIDLIVLKKAFYTKNLMEDIEILFQVPFYMLLNPKSSKFNLIYSPVYNVASENFIEALIDHLVLEISNCIIYFSILNFSTIYAFRQTLYRSKFLSLRNFERFKNNLNWQLIIKKYIRRPIDLYNNRYEIFIVRTNGIYCQTIYANRSTKISSLKNISLITLIFVEFRDFIASRVDETIYSLSKNFRFVVTSGFGQVIGLVWRGIIEGLKK